LVLEADRDILPERGKIMARKPGKLAFIFATVLAVAAFVTINTWAVAKHDNGWKALSATGTIYRSSQLSVVY
jgi:hypothetical protein